MSSSLPDGQLSRDREPVPKVIDPKGVVGDAIQSCPGVAKTSDRVGSAPGVATRSKLATRTAWLEVLG